MWRETYALAADPEVYLDHANLRTHFEIDDGATRGAGGRLEDDVVAACSAIGRASADLGLALSCADDVSLQRRLARLVLKQTSPMASVLGAWFQGMTAPGVFEDSVYLSTLTLLADDLGVGKQENSRSDAFRVIAERHDITECCCSPRELATASGIADEMYRLPSAILALSRRSDQFAPELCGVDRVFRALGLLPPWRLLSLEDTMDLPWQRLDMSIALTDSLGAGEKPVSVSQHISEAIAAVPGHAARIRAGIHFATTELLAWLATLQELALVSRDPALEMALLLRERAREARVYHQKCRLKGKSLSIWFDEARNDPLPLLDALSQSAMVRPGRPDDSPLIGSLIAPGGPMFRIFRTEDIAIIKRWIASLTPVPTLDTIIDELSQKPLSSLLTPLSRFDAGHGNLEEGTVPGSIREAYHCLQGRALPPATRKFADAYIQFWLERAQQSIDATDRSLPGHWTPCGVSEWLRQTHEQRGVEHLANQDQSVPERDQIVEQTIQLAPLTLIDGAWLQGFTETSLASTRIGFSLFETYWDELGNGNWDINHPKIYRDVLRSMGVELPATGSAAFSEDQRINDESFRLPVFWLAIGKFPETYLPEILGLNLAMELSGVGGSYRSARENLRHHGFPTLFVDLHNTIDNVSNGHSAWAAQAVDTFMQQSVCYSPRTLLWERVRTGFEALGPLVKNESELDYFSRKREPKRIPKGVAVATGESADCCFHQPIACSA